MMKTNDLNILYEDNHIIVVVKPENVLSQKDYTNDLDMMTIIKQYIKVKYNKPGDVFLGLVHRLDRRVSGIMVFAKTSKAASRLSEHIREHDISKEYIAIVKNKTPKNGVLKNYIAKINNEDGAIAEIVDSNYPQAKEAVLEYETIKYIRLDGLDFSIVKINLITGRYNQIRKQFAYANYPLINDFKYGYFGQNYNDQLGLTCCKLTFPHPTKKEILIFEYYPKVGIWKNLEEVK